MALKAQEHGDHALAELLTERAGQYIDAANGIGQPTQQQQQPQQKDSD
jgi:hypothetical protein